MADEYTRAGMPKQLAAELRRLDKRFRAGDIGMLEWQRLKAQAFSAARAREQSIARTTLAVGPL